MPQIDLSILNQRQTPAFYADVLANRPAAGFIGRIFVSTNTFEFYRDNGTGWDLIGGPGAGTVTGSGAAGQVTYWNGASSVTGDNGLFYDSVNDRLGIGTTTPGAAIDAHSTQSTILQLNQIAINDTRIAFQLSGAALWRIGNFYNGGANDFELFDVIGAQASITVKKTSGQVLIGTSTVGSGKLVVASATGDNGIQIVSASAPSLRIDNAASGPTKRAGLGISTAVNNFIQGSADRDFCIFNGSTTAASPILFGVYDAGLTNVQEAARISAARNFIINSSTDAGFRLDVNGTARVQGILTASTSITTPGQVSCDNVALRAIIGLNLINTTGTQCTLASYGNNVINGTQNNYAIIPTNINPGANGIANALQVSPSGTATGNGSVRAIFVDGNMTLATGYYRAIETTRGDVCFNTTSGSTLIGTITNAGFKLDVAGTARVQARLTIQNGGIQVEASIAGGRADIIAPVNSGFLNVIQMDQPNSRFVIQRGNLDGGAVVGRVSDNSGEFRFTSNTNFNAGFFTFFNTGGRLVTFADSGSILLGTNSDLASSILTMNSTTRGFLPPRMTTAQKNLIGTPATGLMVYDTTLNKLAVFTGVNWETVTSV
jgi:hypothetical protein